MNILIKSALLAGATLAIAAQPALAQSRPAAAAANVGPVVPGLAVVNLEQVVANADANRVAQQQRPVTYKAQIDAYEARRTQIANQLKPLYEKIDRDSKAAAPNQAALQQQAIAIRQLEENGQAELNKMIQPVAYSQAFVTEQLEDKLDQAVKNAMSKKQISLLLSPQAIVALNNTAYNLNPTVLAELNTLLPTAQLVPPQGWEPRQLREERARQAAASGAAPAAPAAPAARPAGPQPEGR